MRSRIIPFISVVTVFITVLLACLPGSFLVAEAASETVIVTCSDSAPQYTETGLWKTSSLMGYNGLTTRYTAEKGASAVFRPILSRGKYVVSYYRVLNNTSQTASPLTVYHADGQQTYYFNGTVGAAGWVGLDYFTFADGDSGYVEIVSNDSNTNLRASAVKFEKVEDVYPPVGSLDLSSLADGKVTVSFYEQLAKNSVTKDCAALTDMETGERVACAAELSEDGRKITVTPQEELGAGCQYELLLQAGIADLYGNEAEKQVFGFETEMTDWPLLPPDETNVTDAEIYVAPDGNDDNDGTLSEPLKTFEAAKNMASGKIRTSEGNVKVYFRGGTYTLDETVTFSHKDSAPDGKRITYCAYGNEKPVFTGEKPVGGWMRHEGDIWKCRVATESDFRQLYCGEKKLVRARTPNEGESYLLAQEKTKTGFLVQKGVIPTENYKGDAEIAVKNVWMHKRLNIASVTDLANATQINIKEDLWNDVLAMPQGSTSYYGKEYYLENAYEFIDMEGEWYYDGSEGMLYLKSTENPDYLDITIPQLESIIALEGDIKRPVKNLSFSGLSFKRTNWTYPSDYGFNDIQANTLIPPPEKRVEDSQYRYGFKKEYLPGAFNAKTAVNVKVENCIFYDLGGNGINFKDGGAHIEASGNTIYNCAGSAIEAGDDSYRPDSSRLRLRNALICNNLIRNIGTEYYGSIGILVFYADGVRIEHNDINKTSYSAINAGWGWSNDEFVDTARNYTVHANKVENFCTQVKDGGGIYVPNPVYGTSVISDNLIIGSEQTMRAGTMVGGIYHDAFSTNWTDQNNVLLSVTDWAMGVTDKNDIRYQDKTIHFEHNYVTSHKKTPPLAGEFVSFTNTVMLDGTAELAGEVKDIAEAAGLTDAYKNHFSDLPDLFFAEYGIYEVKPSEQGEIKLSLSTLPATVTAESKEGVRVSNALISGSKATIPFFVCADTVPGVYTVLVSVQSESKLQTEEIHIAVLEAEDTSVYVSITDDGYTENGSFYPSGLSGYRTGSRYGYADGISASFQTSVEPGFYKVYVFRVSEYRSCKNTVAEVHHKYGSTQKTFDFAAEPSQWLYAGTFEFDTVAEVVMKKTGSGYLRTSDIKLERVSQSAQNEDGTKAEGLIGNSVLSGKVTLGNYAENDRKFAIYAALYNETGRLVNLAQSEKIIKSNCEEKLETNITLPDSHLERCRLKILVWEMTDKGLLPIFKPIEISGS